MAARLGAHAAAAHVAPPRACHSRNRVIDNVHATQEPRIRLHVRVGRVQPAYVAQDDQQIRIDKVRDHRGQRVVSPKPRSSSSSTATTSFSLMMGMTL